MKLHHIGIVVDDIKKYLGPLTDFLEINETFIPFENSLQKIYYVFIKSGDVFLELIQPSDDASPVSIFLKKGGGLHHIAFEVEDLEKELKKLENKGGKVLYKPEKAFEGRTISFVFMNTFPFKIIELVSKKPVEQ